jgi:hypothetical protein
MIFFKLQEEETFNKGNVENELVSTGFVRSHTDAIVERVQIMRAKYVRGHKCSQAIDEEGKGPQTDLNDAW